MELSTQQKVSMQELINSNGWKLLVEKLEKQKLALESRMFSGQCVDMIDYLSSAKTVQFIHMVITTPTLFIAQSDLQEELGKQDEYDGS